MIRKPTLKTSMLAAGAIAVSLIAFQPAPAAADVQIHFGFNGPSYHSAHGGQGNWRSNRVSCNAARRILRNQYGFRGIRALDCRGATYTFRARRHGDVWRIKVNSRTGQVVRVRRA